MLRLSLLSFAIACGDKDTIDSGGDSATPELSCATAGAAFEGDDGAWTDLTAELEAGSAEAPAVYALDTPGALWLCPGTWHLNVEITAATGAVRAWDAGEVILSGGGPIVSAVDAAASVEGLTLTGGSASFGGAIHVEGGSMQVVDAIVQGNAAITNGGGIYCKGCDLALSEVEIAENSASYFYGGGVAMDEGTLSIEGGRFEGNAARFAAGIELFAATATISGTSFVDNTADDYAGAIEVYSSELAATDCSFSGNAPDDVYHTNSATAYVDVGDGASFTCSDAEGGCELTE